MEWIIVLKGDEHDLEDLSKVYYSPDLTIKKVLEKDHSYYSLTSTQFSRSLPYLSVKKIAQNLAKDFTAATILLRNSKKPIEVEYITQVDETGKKSIFLEATISATSSMHATLSVGKSDGSIEVHNAAEPIVLWLKIKQNDKNVVKVFKYINHDFDSWFTLYNILETLEEDNFKPIMRGGDYRAEADRFFATASNYQTLGEKSRHAKEFTKKKKRIDPLENPMTLSEAQEFIKLLVKEWLKTKESNSCN